MREAGARMAGRGGGRLACLAVIAALTALSACQATGTRQAVSGAPADIAGQASASTARASYGIFYSPADHLAELLQADDLDGASQVYESQRSWFAAGGDSREAPLLELATRLGARLSPKAEAAQRGLDAVSWPAGRERWRDIRVAVEAADRALRNAAQHDILSEPRYRPAAIARLDDALAALWRRLEADAPQAFLDYPLASAPFFAATYPVELELRTMLAKSSWQGRLAAFDRAGLRMIARMYGKRLPQAMARELGQALYAAAAAEGGVAGALATASEAAALGIDVGDVPDSRAVLVDVTSRTLMRQGAIEFPTSVVADLPYRTVETDLDRAFDGPAAAAEVIVLVDVASARTDRRITRREDVESEVQVGTRVVPNPAYAAAQIEVAELILELRESQIQNALNASTPCNGIGCTILGLGGIVGEIAVEQRLQDAKAKLARTPPTLSEPVYRPYAYNRTTIEAAKTATVHYYVIDRRAGTYLRDTFDLRETATFTVAYGLDAHDRNRAAAQRRADDEADLAEFEAAAVEVKLSHLLERFARASSSAETLPSLEKIRAQIVADKNAAIAAEQARTYVAAAGAGDTRFDSVVVVYHPQGLGSGFYVADDVVLTNFHVIEQTRFVEIALFNGLETTGKVIASDPRLDLALIEVKTRGRPVTFFAERSLTLGAEVEAIGHPRGLEFTITRGIVGALREIESHYMPGGRKVRFIQTDTAINAGNSGGPLFLGERVIGVNTQKLADVDIEGLSFAVHYGEVLDFLARNGIVPGTGS